MKKILNKINLGPVLWTLFCMALGTIGWLIHNPELYQPWWAWVIGTIFFETVIVAAVLVISMLTSSIFFNDDDIEGWLTLILTVTLMALINIFMGFNLWESWN